MTSGSEYDPHEHCRRNKISVMFSSGSSSEIEGENDTEEPENTAHNSVPVQDDVEDVPHISKGKKRLRNPDKWKRSLKRQKLFKEKNKRREIGNCRCKCATKLSALEQINIFERYCSLSTHAEQTIYLQGCVKKVIKSRSRLRNNERPRSRTVFSYEVSNSENEKISLCQKAFLALHGIFKSRLEKKVRTAAQPTDNRGRHATRPNRTSLESLEKIRKFLSELPARESHYTRSDSRNRKYLDPNLSITKLHENFNTSHPDNKISYGVFAKVFNEDFNISFGYPRKDICNTCTKLLVNIRQAELQSNNEETLKTLKREKELHLRKAEVFKTKLAEVQKSTDSSEMIICFDFEKNLPLPVTNAQDEYYISQLWLHIFGIHNLKTHKATMYTYTENFAQKGPNEVITCLSDYIEKHKAPLQTKLIIFCDNAFSQNKNRILFTYLDQLCKSNVFKDIEIWYPVPGHSMMPIDRDFGAIEKKRLKLEVVDNPETYIELIRTCRKKNPFEIVFVQHNLRSSGELAPGDRVLKVKDYKQWVLPYIRISVPGISKTRFVKFESGKPIQTRETMTGMCNNTTLYKVGMNRKISNVPKLAYGDSYLKIKPKKFESVTKLVNLVISGDIEFYRRTLLNVNNMITTNRHNTVDDDQDIESDTDIYE